MSNLFYAVVAKIHDPEDLSGPPLFKNIAYFKEIEDAENYICAFDFKLSKLNFYTTDGHWIFVETLNFHPKVLRGSRHTGEDDE